MKAIKHHIGALHLPMACLVKPSDAEGRFLQLLRGVFLLSFLLVGLYYELCSACISICLMGLLFWKARNGKVIFRFNDAALAVCAVWLFYLLGCLWGTDWGLALWGAVKYLPLPLFAVCLMQLPREKRLVLLEDIPWIGCGMTVLTYILQFTPWFGRMVSVNGRLAGFFQYPNTFACFLLLGIELLLLGGRAFPRRWMRWLCGAVLFFGLLQAGSRTIFVLTVPAVLICLLVRRNQRLVLFGVCSAAGGALLSAAAGWLGGITGAERVFAISADASTLLGRLLYWKDALPVIAGRPLGMGYLGYYITQGSFQTGVYSVRWVHNDILQLLLDVGWIPTVLAVITVVKALCSKRSTALQRVVLLTLLAHCMMDFDLEFVSMYWVLLLCLEWEDMKRCILRLSAVPAAVLTAVLGLGSLYIGLTSTLTYNGRPAAASALCPWNTLSNTALLSETVGAQELDALADRILAQNDSVAPAWDAKALAAYSRGDFETVIKAERQAISLARYSIELYEGYFEKLRIGVELYQAAGDTVSADICYQEIESLQPLLDDLASQTDPLAWRLRDQPELTMPQEYAEYLKGG